eukprot:TRINITY_DN144_c0_g1_i4.p1 TRINITY_DN144_c0_g1~~TRINITY_DN144_c0_g1_i4.p1  ORF type:complete len:268 (-),score=34.86 TRINITY_DN144_c0_g1_i4:136-939(-)
MDYTTTLQKIIIAPLERCKIIIQSGNGRGKGIKELVGLVIKREGIIMGGFKAIPIVMIKRVVSGYLEEKLRNATVWRGEEEEEEGRRRRGGVVGKIKELIYMMKVIDSKYPFLATIVLLYPLETIIIRLSSNISRNERLIDYFGIVMNCIRTIWKEKGILGFYSGLFLNLLNIVLVDFVNRLYSLQNRPFFALCSACFLSYSLDTIRTQFIVAPFSQFNFYSFIVSLYQTFHPHPKLSSLFSSFFSFLVFSYLSHRKQQQLLPHEIV